MSTTAILVAAGMGKRMESEKSKQLIHIGGKPIIWHTIHAFQKMKKIDTIIVVVKEDEKAFIEKEIVRKGKFNKVKHIVAGGMERSDSVFNGLQIARKSDIVLIHDGARPFIKESSVEMLLKELDDYDGAILGIPLKDTIKEVNDSNEVLKTYDRKALIAVQTPQAFKASVLLSAFQNAPEIKGRIYDDAMLVESMSHHKIKVVIGDDTNIKITTPIDLVIGEAIFNQNYL